MMSLTLPWLMPQAMAIWVWLAPAYWRTRAKSRPMSRLRRAAMVSARCQNESGIMIKSFARPGMPFSSSVRGARAWMLRD